MRKPFYCGGFNFCIFRSVFDLDRFLRAFWLECCGHLSSFEIDGETFISEKIESGDRGMNIAQGKEVRIMARNAPPDIRCQSCDKPATGVCCQCVYEGAGWVCIDCAKLHECGEDMLLPVVNSPRVGMCDYTGGDYD